MWPRRLHVSMLGTLAALGAAAPATGGTFQGLGDLPGGVFFSEAAGVSADGVTVVGFGNSSLGLGAFRWTPSEGMVGLGDLPGGSYASRAFAVSADGSTIVGRGVSASGPEAFRWTGAAGMAGLELEAILGFSRAHAAGETRPAEVAWAVLERPARANRAALEPGRHAFHCGRCRRGPGGRPERP